MLKGFLITIVAVLLSVAVLDLHAQVYKCEGPSGIVFSDMPCGETAEEIEVEGMEPPITPEEAESEAAGDEVPDEIQRHRNFLGVLNSQKQVKIEEVDQKLASLRVTMDGPGFESLDAAEQQGINDQIADLELERQAVVAEYDGLIAEMERRIETDEVMETATGQLQ